VEELVHQHGRAALEELPGIGKHIARSIEHYVETGEWQFDGSAVQDNSSH
jgi:DNA polymerase/3'-5' exonuclease PolX